MKLGSHLNKRKSRNSKPALKLGDGSGNYYNQEAPKTKWIVLKIGPILIFLKLSCRNIIYMQKRSIMLRIAPVLRLDHSSCRILA